MSAPPLPLWRTLLAELEPNAERLAPLLPAGAGGELEADAAQLLASTLGQAYLSLFACDPSAPQWVPMLNIGFNVAAPNADTTYYIAIIEDGGIYRVAGNRGTSLQVVIGVGGDFFGLTDTPGPFQCEVDLDELPPAADGEFEIIFSAERPEGYDGPWQRLEPGAGLIGVRSVACDWTAERDPLLTIERLDRPVSAPRPSPEDIADRLQALARWPARVQGLWLKLIEDMRAQGCINHLRENRFAGVGGLSTQYYYEGLFDIADDEALILETPLPEQRFYWSVLLTDELFRTINFATRQSSLNEVQAQVDGDGVFRAVIALHDPGVPNWLDTGGYRRGTIQGRWNRCSDHPLPSLRRVPLTEVHWYLPENTPAITAEERQSSLRKRARGAQLRRRW